MIGRAFETQEAIQVIGRILAEVRPAERHATLRRHESFEVDTVVADHYKETSSSKTKLKAIGKQQMRLNCLVCIRGQESDTRLERTV